jgi:hypothetical protein
VRSSSSTSNLVRLATLFVDSTPSRVCSAPCIRSFC